MLVYFYTTTKTKSYIYEKQLTISVQQQKLYGLTQNGEQK